MSKVKKACKPIMRPCQMRPNKYMRFGWFAKRGQ